jgi:hypothetical protein
VPEGSPWPKETWGRELGQAVRNIRAREQFVKGNAEARAWLEDNGFVWRVNSVALKWGIVATAITAYKGVHGNLEIPITFVVPASTPWPKETWSMKLGVACKHIRGREQFVKGNAERRAWLGSIGFVWGAPEVAALGLS